MSSDSLRRLTRPVFDDNPIALQVLGVCSALAVTKTLLTALVMCLALTAVLVASNASISAIRRWIPRGIRLIVQITIIASLVIVTDQFLRAFAWELSKELSVFVGLIITNCIVLGRAETFAMHNSVGKSALDGLGNGLGYSVVLIAVASLRELLGAGSLLGYPLLPLASEGGWFQPLALMRSAPSAFFIIGGLIWLLRSWKTAQVELPEAGGSAPLAPGRDES
jgi:Na+-transporting NADH:ubiquinone oxidoreductase subunit D